MSNRSIMTLAVSSAVLSLVNTAILLWPQSAGLANSARIPAVAAIDWTKDVQFRKAVESIAEATAETTIEEKDYIDKQEAENLIESCVVLQSRKIQC